MALCALRRSARTNALAHTRRCFLLARLEPPSAPFLARLLEELESTHFMRFDDVVRDRLRPDCWNFSVSTFGSLSFQRKGVRFDQSSAQRAFEEQQREAFETMLGQEERKQLAAILAGGGSQLRERPQQQQQSLRATAWFEAERAKTAEAVYLAARLAQLLQPEERRSFYEGFAQFCSQPNHDLRTRLQPLLGAVSLLEARPERVPLRSTGCNAVAHARRRPSRCAQR